MVFREDFATAIIRAGKPKGEMDPALKYEYQSDHTIRSFSFVDWNTPANFHRWLTMFSLPKEPNRAPLGKNGNTYFIWETKDLRVVSHNNPDTGERATAGHSPYSKKKGLMGDMGLVGDPKVVKEAADILSRTAAFDDDVSGKSFVDMGV